MKPQNTPDYLHRSVAIFIAVIVIMVAGQNGRSWHVHGLLERRSDPAQAEGKMREHVQFGNEDDHAALREYLGDEAGEDT